MEEFTLTLRRNNAGCLQLPDAERIQGLLLYPNPDPSLARVAVQIETAGAPRALDLVLPIPVALRLCSLLLQMSHDQGYETLRLQLERDD